jgi:hypothetical protein
MRRRSGLRQLLPAVLLATVVPAAAGDAAFAVFLQAFRAALARPDPAAVADLTRLPFLFDGTARDRAAFVKLIPQLFDPPTRACMSKSPPRAEAEAMVLDCPPYAFYFRRQPHGGYRLEEFAADGEEAE